MAIPLAEGFSILVHQMSPDLGLELKLRIAISDHDSNFDDLKQTVEVEIEIWT